MGAHVQTRIQVENPRNRHIGLKILRTIAFFLVALTPLPPLLIFGVYVYYARDLPELEPIESYYAELQAPTTFHAADGLVIGEFYEERRLFRKLTDIPIPLIQAFLAAEDERFFQHDGVDPRSIVRAAVTNLTAGRIVQGASTLTQQLAKSMLGNEKSYRRKVREAILARRMEDVYSKSEILTLYLNKIFLGHNSYGVQAAAQNYFRKNVEELTLGQMAVLSVLPPSPSTVNPIRNLEKTLERRRHVLERMLKNGYITAEESAAAAEEPVVAYPLLDEFHQRVPLVAVEGRKRLNEVLPDRPSGEEGEDTRWMRGYRVYTTVEVDLQHDATQVLTEELGVLDRKQGYRGPVGVLEEGEIDSLLERAEDYYLAQGMLDDGELQPGAVYLAVATAVEASGMEVRVTPTIGGRLRQKDMKWAGEYAEFPLVEYRVHRRGGKTTVTKVEDDGTVAYEGREMEAAPFADDHPDEREGELAASELNRAGDSWTIRKRDETARVSWNPKLSACTDAFEAGAVVLVTMNEDGALELTQQPRVQGAVLTWSPWTGYVRAMVGGTDFDVSQVNRTRALRQTGSTMKPIYYSLAYDMGLRPSYAHSDAPFAEGGFASTGGSSEAGTMLTYNGLVKSRNTVSLRVSRYVTNHLKEGQLTEWQKALGLAHPLQGHLAEILGGDQTPWSMSGAFSLFLTGGVRSQRTVVRKIVDRQGRLLHDATHLGDPMIDPRETVHAMYRVLYRPKTRAMRESVAFIMRHNLRGVVRAGTATKARRMSHPAAGKTGSLPFDIWFNGFTGQAITTVWVGADNRERILGRSKQRSGVYGAGPPLRTFIRVTERAVAGLEEIDFLKPVPSSIEMVAVDPKTGNRTMEGGVSLPHRAAFVPLYVHKGEGSTDDIHHSETDF